jgi:ATP-binding cassette subfamily C protein
MPSRGPGTRDKHTRPRNRMGAGGFFSALRRENPGRLLWLTFVQVTAALGQGLAILLLVPLLQAVGVGDKTGVGRWVRAAFHAFGLRLTLATVLSVYVVVVAVSAVLSAYQSVLATRYRLEFADHLRSRLYSAIARAEWRHLLGLRQSDVLSVLTVNMTWVSQGAAAALSLVVAVILVGTQLLVAIRISPSLTALAAATGAGTAALVWPLVKRSRRLGRELVENNRNVLGLATGFLDALKLAKAHGLEGPHVAAFDDAIRRSRGSQIAFAKASAIANAVQMTLTAVVLAALVGVGVKYLHLALSELLVVAFVFARVVPQIRSAQQNVQSLAQALPSFDEVTAMIAGCEEAEEPPALAPGGTRERIEIGDGVRLDEVRFAYPDRGDGTVEAVRGVSLELPAHSTTALVGRSGAGKSTLADLVVGLLAPSSGTIHVGGRPLNPQRVPAWRAAVALVPQDPFLFHDTIRSNLCWTRPTAGDDELWEALEMAAAEEFVRDLPDGLDTVVGDRGMRLSGGERQRLALARALLRDPELLVLDEATSSLDSENELAIRRALARLHGRTSMLIIAHRLSTVSHADRIVVMADGAVVERGTWDELSRLPNGRLRSLIQAGAIEASAE